METITDILKTSLGGLQPWPYPVRHCDAAGMPCGGAAFDETGDEADGPCPPYQ